MLNDALVPVFLLIILGFILSRSPISSESMWRDLEKLTYYLFFPALLVTRLSSADVLGVAAFDIARVLGLALFIVTVLLVLFRRILAADGSTFSSIYQGSIRLNTYIGLAVIEALYGERGLVQAALALAIYIPAVNVLCVIALHSNANSGFDRMLDVSRAVLSNPLVIACVLGLVLSVVSWEPHRILQETLIILSQPALPLGLLTVGAGIRFVSMGPQTLQLLVATLTKLGIFPMLVLVCCFLFEVPTSLALILLILTCLPAPPSAYILARQLGGNVSLMANIITLETLLTFVSLPLWLEFGPRWL